MLKDAIVSFGKPKSIAAEAYRTLRTNLEFSMSNDGAKSILITSSHVSEGKSSVASNLATVFAMQNKRTILVDADMRRGVQHKRFDLTNMNGLSNYLANINIDQDKLIKTTEIPNLYVITSGPVPPNPSELISLNRMKDLMSALKDEFDIVIFDGAPALPVTDSIIISSFVDRVVIVASSGETHKDELKSVKLALDNAGARVVGVVLNKVDIEDNFYGKYSKYGKGYYGGYYSSDDDSKKKKKRGGKK